MELVYGPHYRTPSVNVTHTLEQAVSGLTGNRVTEDHAAGTVTVEWSIKQTAPYDDNTDMVTGNTINFTAIITADHEAKQLAMDLHIDGTLYRRGIPSGYRAITPSGMRDWLVGSAPRYDLLMGYPHGASITPL